MKKFLCCVMATLTLSLPLSAADMESHEAHGRNASKDAEPA